MLGLNIVRNNFGRLGLARPSLDSLPIPSVRTQIIGTKAGPLGGGSGTGVQGDASHLSATSRFRIDMPAYDTVLLGVEYWNGRISFNSGGEIAGANTVNNKAAWESAVGVLTSLFDSAGNRTTAITAGSRTIMRPASRLVVPGGSLPFVRQYVSLGATGTWPASRIAHNSTLGESENTFGTGAGTDQVDATGTFGSATSVYAWGPSAIYGVPADGLRRKAVALFQDSIGTVSGGDGATGYGDANGYAGWIERKIGSQIATTNAARASSRLQWVAAGFANQLAMIGPYVSSAIIQLGRNDVSNSRTLQNMKDDFATIATALQGYGVAVYASTITPKPATTANSWVDGGATLTTAEETVRNAYNTWLKTLPAGIRACFDICAYVEDGARPGYWNASYTTDGTHLTVTAMQAAASAIDLNVLV